MIGQRKGSRQLATSMVKTGGPLVHHVGGATSTSKDNTLANSHRQVNKKVKNARDILKVADYKSELKFEQYKSPASQKVRVTSAAAKRSVSELRVQASASNWSPSAING